MFHSRITQSLSEIETICESKKDEMLSYNIPAKAYPLVNKHVNGTALRVWQEFPATSLLQIVDTFKSRLLNFILEFNKEIKSDISFSNISPMENEKSTNQIMNNTYNINAAIANTGDGTVNTRDVNAIDFQFTPSNDVHQQMKNIVDEIEKILKQHGNAELDEPFGTIKEEASKPSWNKKIMKMAFNAINGIATGIAANQLTPVVAQGLRLLV